MSGVKEKYQAYKARKIEAAAEDKERKQKIKAFKEKFDVKVDDKDWNKVFAGMDTGLAELNKWVVRIEGMHGASAADARQDYDAINRDASVARGMFTANPQQIGTQIRDGILPDLRTLIDIYRVAAKNTPCRTSVQTAAGTRTVSVFWTDIPGYDELSSQQQQAVTQALAEKVARGMDAYDNLANGGAVPTQVTARDATDFIWAMKSKAQEKSGPYAKGAMTIPNGEKAREYLDKCGVVYPRKSSHLKEQQSREGQSARGMDFYNGTAGLASAQPNVDGMLPFGMNTVLYQQVAGTTDKKLLYIKFETEGAPGTGGGNRATDTTAPPDPPGPNGIKAQAAQRLSNAGKTIRHGGNYVKSRIKKDEPDKDLKSTREELPKPIKKLCKDIIKEMPKGPAKAALAGTFDDVGRLNTFLEALDMILNLPNQTYPAAWTDKVGSLGAMCIELYSSDAELENRFGGEVSLSAADMA